MKATKGPVATLIEASVNRICRRISPKEFEIYHCYVDKQWPAEQVAQEFGVTVTQVYLAKTRVMAAIEKEVRQIKASVLWFDKGAALTCCDTVPIVKTAPLTDPLLEN